MPEMVNKNMEIPTLSEKERQKMNCEMFVGNNYVVVSFIMQKLGPRGVKEYHEWLASAFRDVETDAFWSEFKHNPMGFAMTQATSHKKLYGSDVDVVPNTDGSVTLDIKECGLKKADVGCEKEGGPIKKAEQCDGCITDLKLITERLEMKLRAEFADEGCKMTIRERTAHTQMNRVYSSLGAVR